MCQAAVDFELAALEHAHNYRRALAEEFGPYLHGDVLEVGAGVGHFSERIVGMSQVQSLVAVEPAAHLASSLRERAQAAEIVCGTFDAVRGRDFDAIVSVNVLEHIEDDGGELREYAKALTARRGHLCLFVPARQEIYAPIDRDFGHYRRYSKRSLRARLEGAGLAVVRLDYFNLVGYFAWAANFCVLRKRVFEIEKVKLFDRAIFPVVHRLERRFGAPPIGQSLIAVARSLSGV